ncbi:DUF1003 domain-containing protein [Sphingomonas rubra]|uniref:DUF1003 domain-containing protein n=1 Tax=Sphingomonas rubra TaxID=634430 RepID=A0A1I5TM52_9SPHN|nr:DUF1003 domain-containing protein [Sphingomonas rubra]SFP83416.1 Protein of unknown function [Sphingomonas rubra]
MSTAPPPAGIDHTLQENIERLAERRRRTAAEAPLGGRLSDAITAFAGSMSFVAIHLTLFGGWIVVNLGWLPIVRPFDPSFVVLAMVASVEAIFLSTFVLISQNRMAAAADRRADLDLHINLLAEHELSRLTALVARIARKLDIPFDAAEIGEVERDVPLDRVQDAIDAAVPSDT